MLYESILKSIITFFVLNVSCRPYLLNGSNQEEPVVVSSNMSLMNYLVYVLVNYFLVFVLDIVVVGGCFAVAPAAPAVHYFVDD